VIFKTRFDDLPLVLSLKSVHDAQLLTESDECTKSSQFVSALLLGSKLSVGYARA